MEYSNRDELIENEIRGAIRGLGKDPDTDYDVPAIAAQVVSERDGTYFIGGGEGALWDAINAHKS